MRGRGEAFSGRGSDLDFARDGLEGRGNDRGNSKGGESLFVGKGVKGGRGRSAFGRGRGQSDYGKGSSHTEHGKGHMPHEIAKGRGRGAEPNHGRGSLGNNRAHNKVVKAKVGRGSGAPTGRGRGNLGQQSSQSGSEAPTGRGRGNIDQQSLQSRSEAPTGRGRGILGQQSSQSGSEAPTGRGRGQVEQRPAKRRKGHKKKPVTKQLIQNVLGQAYFIPDSVTGLGEEQCYSILQGLAPEMAPHVRDCINFLQLTVRKIFPSAVLYIFGSSVTGLAEQTSDLDICCDCLGHGDLAKEMQNEAGLVRKVARLLRDQRVPVIPVSHARCPIIVFNPPPKPKYPFITSMDLSFRCLGAINSHLIREYFSDPAARIAAIAIKLWSKSAGINNSRHQYLSSYALTLMFIYFGLRCGYFKFLEPMMLLHRPLEPVPSLFPVPVSSVELTEKVSFLIAGFFWFYGTGPLEATSEGSSLTVDMPQFKRYASKTTSAFQWKTHVVSINTTDLQSKQKLGWVSAGEDGVSSLRNVKNFHLAVLDPYDPMNLNCARNLDLDRYLHTRLAMRWAWLNISQKNWDIQHFKNVCQFSSDGMAELLGEP